MLLPGINTAAARRRPCPARRYLHNEKEHETSASDVLFFPPEAAEIKAEIDEAFGLGNLLDALNEKTLKDMRMNVLIGEAASFLKCLEELKIAARTEANTLILGETGTGKEIFARAIHRLEAELVKAGFLQLRQCACQPTRKRDFRTRKRGIHRRRQNASGKV